MTDAVVRELAAAAGLSIWPPRDDERLVVGDPETRHSLVLRSGSWLVERLDRGRAETEAACSDAAAGRALLVRHLAAGARGHRGWPPIDHTRLAPGTRLEEVPDGQRLSWSHGWAVFRSAAVAS